MIRLLFDERMSPRLVGFAQRRGFDATHLSFLGLAKTPDRLLLPVIAGGDYTFVPITAATFSAFTSTSMCTLA